MGPTRVRTDTDTGIVRTWPLWTALLVATTVTLVVTPFLLVSRIGDTICDVVESDGVSISEAYDSVNSPGPGEVGAWWLVMRLFLAVVVVAMVAVAVARWRSARPPTRFARALAYFAVPMAWYLAAMVALTNGTIGEFDDCAEAISITPLTVSWMGLPIVAMAVAGTLVGRGRTA